MALLEGLDSIAKALHEELAALDEAREKVLRLSREVIRSAAGVIRSVHRGEMDRAREELDATAGLMAEMIETAAPFGLLRHARFVLDAEKEYCEAAMVLAAVEGKPAPTPQELEVDGIAWVNGLAEVVGELRRHVLDLIRARKVDEAEKFLGLMEEIYYCVMSFDLPDALTGGLRGRTDQARGAVERTRGELTMAIQQADLVARLEEASRWLEGGGPE